MPAGRPAGSINRQTAKVREAIAALLDNTAPELAKWLKEVYEAEGPNEALKRVNDMLEFAVPKLARTELTGKDGEPMQIQQIARKIIDEKP